MIAVRRLAAILAANVVGYSMLFSRKEVGRQFALQQGRTLCR
jgi:hypothetical protein